ncbi:MAG: very short patch repair endonuclease [Ignavibacteriaceae bacterium]|nr:very short patch repair endonuclease [Ignavibacteriaceae bacterium]
MADTVSSKRRSEIMRNVKGKDTTPEIKVRKYLFEKGLRYRLHEKKLPGSPGIVISRYKTVIFINGCFWHRHKNCKRASIPSATEGFGKKNFNKI